MVPVGSFLSSVLCTRAHGIKTKGSNIYINCREQLHSHINLSRRMYVPETGIQPELLLQLDIVSCEAYLDISLNGRVTLGECHFVGLVNTVPLPNSLTMHHSGFLVKLRNGLVRMFSKFNLLTILKNRGLLVYCISLLFLNLCNCLKSQI